MSITGVDLKIIEAIKLAETINVKSSATFGGKHLTVNVTNIVLPELREGSENQRLKELSGEVHAEGGQANDAKRSRVSIVLAPTLGVVEDKYLEGTRIQIEFVVVNGDKQPHVITAAFIRIKPGVVDFKQFFVVTPDDLRAPDPTRRFPLVLGPNGAMRLAVEFENRFRNYIPEGVHRVQLVVELEAKAAATASFSIWIDGDTNATLKHLKGLVKQNGGAVVFDLPINGRESGRGHVTRRKLATDRKAKK